MDLLWVTLAAMDANRDSYWFAWRMVVFLLACVPAGFGAWCWRRSRRGHLPAGFPQPTRIAGTAILLAITVVLLTYLYLELTSPDAQELDWHGRSQRGWTLRDIRERGKLFGMVVAAAGSLWVPYCIRCLWRSARTT